MAYIPKKFSTTAVINADTLFQNYDDEVQVLMSDVGNYLSDEIVKVYTETEIIVTDGIKVNSVETIEDLATQDGVVFKTIIVKDLNRGGTFIWSATGTANGGTVFAGVSGYWTRQYSGAVNVKWFGAKGDGVTNNTSVFVNIRNLINSGEIKHLFFEKDDSYYGFTNHKDDYDTSFYGYSFLFDLADIDGLIIEGNKSEIKALPSSRYGSFNPITGISENKSGSWDVSYAASPGGVFNFTRCKNITMSNIIINGNNDNIIIGGNWGDSGIQIQYAAVRILEESQDISVVDSTFTHMGTDGISIKIDSTEYDQSANIAFKNIVSHYNGRQGISISGGKGIKLENCSFAHTGKAGVSSAPGAGIDVEPELGNSVSDLKIRNCEFLNNTGVGVLIWDNGNLSDGVSISESEIWGNTNSAFWISGGRYFTVENTKIHGAITRAENSKFINCRIDDINHGLYGIFLATYITSNQTNTVYRNCTFTLYNTKGIFGGLLESCVIDCRFDTSLSITGGTLMSFGEGQSSDVTVIDNLTGTFDDTNRFYVTIASTAFVNNLNILGGGNGIRYYNRTGAFGYINSSKVAGITTLSLKNESDYNGTSISGGRYSVPTSGTFDRGYIIFNSNATAGGNIGWVCTASGTFGTLSGVTGSITSGSKLLTVNTTTGLSVGTFITIAGVSGVNKIMSINGTVLTLFTATDVTVADVVVAYQTPIFKTFGAITA